LPVVVAARRVAAVMTTVAARRVVDVMMTVDVMTMIVMMTVDAVTTIAATAATMLRVMENDAMKAVTAAMMVARLVAVTMLAAARRAVAVMMGVARRVDAVIKMMVDVAIMMGTVVVVERPLPSSTSLVKYVRSMVTPPLTVGGVIRTMIPMMMMHVKRRPPTLLHMELTPIGTPTRAPQIISLES
jgi:hypothetical protein